MVTVEDKPIGDAFAYCWRAGAMLSLVVAAISAAWEWASSDDG
jgi:hypothetical protein